jgi:hypothetical protein
MEVKMPGYDGTGPQGIGPNGRRMGPCGGGAGVTRRGFWGFGRRIRGGGRGFWWANRNVGDEKSSLQSEKDYLNQQMEAINKRLNEIEKE